MPGPYLSFVEAWVPPTYKTKVFYVKNKHLGGILGVVRWYPQWRRYTFQPEGSMIFDANCLDEITHFLRDLMTKHKAGDGETNERTDSEN